MTASGLTQTHEILWRHFATQLHDDFLQELVVFHDDLSAAVQGGRIDTPEGRELLIEKLTRKLGLPTWPRRRDTDHYRHYFYSLFGAAVAKVDGTFAYTPAAPSSPVTGGSAAPGFMRQEPNAPSALDEIDGEAFRRSG